jgi:hypothetical protein
MEFVIWGGAALSLLGVFGLIGCIVLAMKARRSSLSEDEMRARLQKVVVLNMGALAVSAIGLMAVIVGIILS